MKLRETRDTIDRMLAEERAAADRAVATRDDVLATVCHDVRTMLSAIAIHAQIVVTRATDREAVVEGGTAIKTMATRLTELVGDLVDVATLDSDQLALAVEPHDVVDLVRQTRDTFAPAARTRGIELAVVADPAELVLPVDATRLGRVLVNLVANALRFTPDHGRITLGARREAGGARLWIADTGPGIPAAKLEAIFDRCCKLDSGARANHGLGLYIARRIVDAHHGKIWAESAGQGATFQIALPASSPKA